MSKPSQNNNSAYINMCFIYNINLVNIRSLRSNPWRRDKTVMAKNICLLNYPLKFSRKLLHFISDTGWKLACESTPFFEHHTFAVVLVPGKHTVLNTITNQSVVDAHVAVTEECVGQTWSCKTELLMRWKPHGWCNTNTVHMMDSHTTCLKSSTTGQSNCVCHAKLLKHSILTLLDKDFFLLQIFLYIVIMYS